MYLPDGNTVEITHIGTVKFSDDLSLSEVLCVPTFKCNLISVAKLTLHSSCQLTFTPTHCLLQDHILRREKGIGELQDGLYKLHTTQLSQSYPLPCPLASKSSLSCNKVMCNSVIDVSLWHNRMGHPSITILNKLQFIAPHSVNFKDCDICHLSKQHILSFSQSEHKANEIFQLIHLDVWGPYRQYTHGHCNYFLTVIDDYSRTT